MPHSPATRSALWLAGYPTPWPSCSTATMDPTFPKLQSAPAVAPGSHITLKWKLGNTANASLNDFILIVEYNSRKIHINIVTTMAPTEKLMT
mmetsp:Transcript_33885/g.62759  ORF Transcript_33885/g.62759 Transcript_33885/m.62759 type:complete len:92 (-) Transcript_33885:429-704(-)